MTSRAPLVRSIPFWLLIVGSLGAVVAGAVMLFGRLTVMTTALTSGTATGVEVYVGQVEAVIGGIVMGAGLVGLALALAVASMRAIVPAASAELAPAPMSEPLEPAEEPASSGRVTSVPTTNPGSETPRTTVGTGGEAPAITRPQAADTTDVTEPRA